MALMDWATGQSSPSDATSLSDDSFHSAIGSPPPEALQPSAPLPGDWIKFFRYVHDTTLVEVTSREAMRHITGNDPTEVLWGELAGGVMTNLISDAEEIGMRINCGKTQAVCISPNTGYTTIAMIRASSVKLIGFVVDSSGGMGGQVKMIKDKFRRRFWSLIHLRKAGIKGFRLYKLYTVLVRPILEANGVVFHTMLTIGQSNELEKLQKHVLRLCFGPFTCYQTLLTNLQLSTLKERRVNPIRKLTAKLLSRNDEFARKWFVPRLEVGTEIRRRRPYVEKKARYLRSPLLLIQKQANDLST